MSNNLTDNKDSIKRLNVLIALLLMNLAKKKTEMGLKEQVQFLSNFSFKNNEIAEILGKSTNYINKEMHLLRKRALNK